MLKYFSICPCNGGGSGTVTGVGSFSEATSLEGLTLSGSLINLDKASATTPGGVSTLAQTFGGNKNFAAKIGVGGVFTPVYDIDIRGPGAESNFRMTESASGSGLHGGRLRYNTGVWEIINYETDTILRNLGGVLQFETDAVRQVPLVGGGHLIESAGDFSISYALSNLSLGVASTLVLNPTTGVTEITNTGFFGLLFSGGALEVNAGNIKISAVGSGLVVAEGADAKQGVDTLVGGTVTVANASVTATSRIIYSVSTAGGVQGFLSTTQVDGVSFTINSTSALDTSTVVWEIFEPA